MNLKRHNVMARSTVWPVLLACAILTPHSFAGEQQEFKGKIAKSYADSEEWWPKEARPPKGAPNVLILLLDDVLSELDARRRDHVLEWASQYQQSFVTSAESDTIGGRHLSAMTRFEVHSGDVRPMAPADEVAE